MVRAVQTDYRTADLVPADRAMLAFSVKLTRSPDKMLQADIAEPRKHGFDDAAIHDIVQVAALFNYYDRLADGMGIEPEPEW